MHATQQRTAAQVLSGQRMASMPKPRPHRRVGGVVPERGAIRGRCIGAGGVTACRSQCDCCWETAFEAMLEGPRTIELMDQAKLALPEEYGFRPREHSVKLMEVMGDPPCIRISAA